jgi:hypothetical protein
MTLTLDREVPQRRPHLATVSKEHIIMEEKFDSHHVSAHQHTPETLPPELVVRPWIDTVVEASGFDPRSMYVELCWLPVLGPTATWLYRRLGTWVEFNDNGVEVDLTDLAVSTGLGEGLGKSSLLGRSLDRLVTFHVARWQNGELEVRRRLAPLPARYVGRLSLTARQAHEQYMSSQEQAS